MIIPEAVQWKDEQLVLLDQRRLPNKIVELPIRSIEDAVDAIRTLAVRGAPAIGIAAAYALAQSMQDAKRFEEELLTKATALKNARPTAVNLAWAVDRLLAVAEHKPSYDALKQEAERIHQEDREQCRRIGDHGVSLIPENANVLTHCNAGALAVSELGTATAPIYKAHALNKNIHVYVDETRPLLQGARLTAWELAAADVPCTLICDNMAATLMAQRKVDLIIVGTDRVARNGDVANKIGTLGLAVLANHFDIPFYVACPSSTYDACTPTGEVIEIEQRPAEEVRGEQAASVPVYNPAFDVTPAELVTALITDKGLFHHPNEQSLELLRQT